MSQPSPSPSWSSRSPRSTITVEARGTDVVLNAHGVIDHEASDVWDRCVSDVLDARATTVTLDLSQVTLLASEGLRLIVDLRQQLHIAGVPFALQGVPVHIGRVLELTGLAPAIGQPGVGQPRLDSTEGSAAAD